LCWNVRGVNSDKKWNAIRDRVVDSNSDVICLQETKRAAFDDAFLRNICPPSFDKYKVFPSNGASGGAIVIWKSSLFHGTLVFHNFYAISIDSASRHNDAHWLLTNIYAPCTSSGKHQFLDWFMNIQMSNNINWIVVGDFNLCRSPDDRNWPGGDISDMLLFNEAINYLGLVDLPLKGKRFSPRPTSNVHHS